jgi:hypothetical protein
LVAKLGLEPIEGMRSNADWTEQEYDILLLIEGKVEDFLIRRNVLLVRCPS